MFLFGFYVTSQQKVKGKYSFFLFSLTNHYKFFVKKEKKERYTVHFFLFSAAAYIFAEEPKYNS